MYRAIIMSGNTIDLTRGEYEYLMKNQQQRFVVFPSESGVARTVNPASISEILPIADAKKFEAERLKTKGMWRCKAGKVHKAGNFNDPHSWECNCSLPNLSKNRLSKSSHSEKLLKLVPPTNKKQCKN